MTRFCVVLAEGFSPWFFMSRAIFYMDLLMQWRTPFFFGFITWILNYPPFSKRTKWVRDFLRLGCSVLCNACIQTGKQFKRLYVGNYVYRLCFVYVEIPSYSSSVPVNQYNVHYLALPWVQPNKAFAEWTILQDNLQDYIARSPA